MTEDWPDPRYRTLTPELLAEISVDEIGSAIAQHVEFQVGATEADRPSVVDALQPGIRAVYTTWLVDLEVNNGGFNQFFFNPCREFAGLALAGYELLGAEDYAAIMRAAIATRETERDRMAPYYDARTFEAFSESYRHTELGELDQRYYALGDGIYHVWAVFVRTRPDLLVG